MTTAKSVTDSQASFKSKRLNEWLSWQAEQHSEEIDLGLDRVKEVAVKMGLLGHKATKVLVAGTNGKGSSVAMLEAVYLSQGYATACFTSPHLIRYNERFRVNGIEIIDQDLIAAFEAIEQAREDIPLTYFEYATLAAIYHFTGLNLDVWIMEVGLGGRLDATNILDADAALITAIDIDHQDWLGETRSEIAYEKAGVCRANKTVVFADFNVPNSALEHAQDLNCQIIQAGVDYQIKFNQSVQMIWDGQSIDLPELKLNGRFQYHNLAGVWMLVNSLQERLSVDRFQALQTVSDLQIPGRLVPLIANQCWCDVGHNAQAARMLRDWINQQKTSVVAVYASLRDKDVSKIQSILADSIDSWHIYPLNSPRAMDLDALESGLKNLKVTRHESARAAIEAGFEGSKKIRGILLIFGSFLTVSDAMSLKMENLAPFDS